MLIDNKALVKRSALISLLMVGVIALTVACSGASSPVPSSAPVAVSQTRCTLTYAAGTPSYTFTVGQFGSVEGGVLADGECKGVGQTINQGLPDGLTFSVDKQGRRWIISGTPSESAGPSRYTILAKATIGSGLTTRSSSRQIDLRVDP